MMTAEHEQHENIKNVLLDGFYDILYPAYKTKVINYKDLKFSNNEKDYIDNFNTFDQLLNIVKSFNETSNTKKINDVFYGSKSKVDDDIYIYDDLPFKYTLTSWSKYLKNYSKNLIRIELKLSIDATYFNKFNFSASKSNIPRYKDYNIIPASILSKFNEHVISNKIYYLNDKSCSVLGSYSQELMRVELIYKTKDIPHNGYFDGNNLLFNSFNYKLKKYDYEFVITFEPGFPEIYYDDFEFHSYSQCTNSMKKDGETLTKIIKKYKLQS